MTNTENTYLIRSCHADKVLDLAQGGPNKGTTIIWKAHGACNQRFSLIKDGDYYLIMIMGNFLTVEG